MNESTQLLQQYAVDHSEEAFSQLVSQYIDLVFSVAYRQANNNTQTAEDITQTVFADLALRAPTLPSQTQIGGWLHRHTCFVASNLRRSEQRRQQRENKALSLEMNATESESNWDDLAPELDQAIDQLSEPDRSAIVLRFFEGRNHREIGEALQASEDTAQKRVSRALNKLRSLLIQQGVTLSIPALIALLDAQCVAAAPAGLGNSVASHIHHSATDPTRPIPNEPLVSRITVGAIAATVIGIAVMLLQSGSAANESSDPTAVTVESKATRVANLDQESTSPIVATTESLAAVPDTNESLRLVIQAKATGERLSGVRIWHRAQLMNRWDVQDLTANRMGEITIPFLRDEVKMLELITKIEGYADLHLQWRPERGETIPSHYTAELIPSTRIGGWVVNQSGQPVTGAKVGFNHEDIPGMRTRPQSFEFSWIEVETDDEGRWEINRIADQILPLIYGSARHPDYSQSPFLFASRDRVALDAMKAGTHRFELAAAYQITGRVTDAQGNPVADASVALGRVGSSGRRKTTGDLDGHFTLRGCQPGNRLLTAEAEGFAATTIRFDVGPSSEAAHLVLNPGRTITLNVTDPHGGPVTDANVWYDTFGDSHDPNSTRPPIAQVAFHAKTDATGSVIWFDAPVGNVSFDVHANGFMRVDDIEVPSGETEKSIVLPSALVVTGTIRDEETDQPIEHVRMGTGYQSPHSRKVNWSGIGRFWIDFSGGEFYHSYEEAVISGISNPGYTLKFEAEGYAPYVTRNIAADEGVVNLDIRLTKATPIYLRVQLPNGQPARQADVSFVRDSSRVTIVPGGLARDGGGSGDVILTDAEGRFQLAPDPEITALLIAHQEGFLHVPVNRVTTDAPLRLQPWGRLTGSYQGTAPGESPITLEVQYGIDPSRRIQLHFQNFAMDLDNDHQFEFNRLPPGVHRLARRHYQEHEGHQIWSSRTLETFTIEAGETTELHLTTHEVQFTVTKPRPFAGASIAAYVRDSGPVMPLSALNDREAAMAWQQQPEVQQTLASMGSFQLAQTEDRVWTSSEISPGKFLAIFRLYQKEANKFTVLARAMVEFTISEGEGPRNLNVVPEDWELVEPMP